MQQLQEKFDHDRQEHQQAIAEKVEKLNSVKVWEERIFCASLPIITLQLVLAIFCVIFWQREHQREKDKLKEAHETLIASSEKVLAEKLQVVARLQVSIMFNGPVTNGTVY